MNAYDQNVFYLGALSPDGYYSLLDELAQPAVMRAVYILKGGPGSGRSRFLRRIADSFERDGYAVERIVSTFDIQEMDGVLIRQAGTAFIDGQSPHLVEARYPSALEIYINMDPFCDAARIRASREPIIRQHTRIQAGIASAKRYIKAAAQLSDNLFDVCIGGVELERIAKRARGIVKRELPKKKEGTRGRVTRRFLSAITPQGLRCAFETVKNQCGRLYELSDSYGLSHFLLTPIRDAALAAGYDVIVCFCPLKPESKLDHLIIPELKLGFVTSNSFLRFSGDAYRRIRMDRYVPDEIVRGQGEKLRSDKKEMAFLLGRAVAELERARRRREELERYYLPYTDLDAVDACADGYAAAVRAGMAGEEPM